MVFVDEKKNGAKFKIVFFIFQNIGGPRLVKVMDKVLSHILEMCRLHFIHVSGEYSHLLIEVYIYKKKLNFVFFLNFNFKVIKRRILWNSIEISCCQRYFQSFCCFFES